MPGDSAGPGAHGRHSVVQCWLWNPQTGEKMALPAMDEELPPYCRCLISDTSYSPPDWVSDDVDLRPDSLVLVYNLTRPELLICRIRGGTAWVRQSYDMGLCEVPGEAPTERAAQCMAAVQGTFYFLKAPGVVGAFCCFAEDPEPCLKLATLDAPDPKIVSYAPQTPAMSYLLESSKELFRVCIFFLGCSLEHIEEMESTPTNDLGSLAASASSFPLLVYDHGEQPENSHTVLSIAYG
ncbi:hypothetical protein BAE44_0008703 [Dichanthelium oligosanthes]|uniref:KIB1-4 beta-propeller domain-containing protein n=1 Tax=Dichanthelium oligosanthes TaxID=888268 RepID=A0A1E5VYU8_9POAL|nr:hypothetical protein BAE44_0008703 [Dichanthelium oligosanthes]